MNNQLIEPKFKTQEITIMLFMLILIIVSIMFGFYYLRISNPYVKEVLSIQGDRSRGEAMFQVNCALCHGGTADGDLGPSLHHISKHKSKVDLINQVVSGKTPPMPQFQPSVQDMADLLSYLEQL